MGGLACSVTTHYCKKSLVAKCLLLSTDSSDKLRQPKIGALMKQVMGTKEDVPGTFSRGGETRVSVCPHAVVSLLAFSQSWFQNKMFELCFKS